MVPGFKINIEEGGETEKESGTVLCKKVVSLFLFVLQSDEFESQEEEDEDEERRRRKCVAWNAHFFPFRRHSMARMYVVYASWYFSALSSAIASLAISIPRGMRLFSILRASARPYSWQSGGVGVDVRCEELGPGLSFTRAAQLIG